MFNRRFEQPRRRSIFQGTESSRRRDFFSEPFAQERRRRFPSETEIGEAGERHFVNSLFSDGYTDISWDTRGPGKTDVMARKNGQLYLFQVKSAMGWGLPAGLSEEEERAIRTRADQCDAWAYLIQIQLDSNLNLVGNIQQTRIWPTRSMMSLHRRG